MNPFINMPLDCLVNLLLTLVRMFFTKRKTFSVDIIDEIIDRIPEMMFLNSQYIVIDFPGKKMRSAVEYEKKSKHHEQGHKSKYRCQTLLVVEFCKKTPFFWGDQFLSLPDCCFETHRALISVYHKM